VKVGAEVDLHNYADGSPYFDDFLKADPTIHTLLDFWAVHPYSGNCSPYATSVDCPSLGQDWRFDRIPKLQQLAASRGASLPIWITEWGYTTATSGVSEATQAKYIADGITRAVTEWGVERVFAYTGDKDGTNPDDREAHYGMRHADGSEKPVWASLRSLLAGSSGSPPPTGTTTTGTTTTAPPPPPPPTTTTTTTTTPTTTQTTTQSTTTSTTPPPPTTTTTTTAPPPPAPTTTTSPGNGKKKGHSRTLAVERPGAAPARTPRWFWPWARWRLGRAEFKPFGAASATRRPGSAPTTIPGWAWQRLEVVRRPGVARRTG